jgi:hypothetical protein
LPAAVRLNGLRFVPSGNDQVQSRETWSLTVSALKIGEI